MTDLGLILIDYKYTLKTLKTIYEREQSECYMPLKDKWIKEIDDNLDQVEKDIKEYLTK